MPQSSFPFRPGGKTPAAPPPAPPRPHVFTVHELCARLRGQVETEYPSVFVGGELSNVQINARSGHAYFTLKDERAQLKCVLFRDQLVRHKLRLADGLKVVAQGRLTIYEPGGQLQLAVSRLEAQGLGERERELRELVEKLRAQGLTSDARKRAIPLAPRVIGVVTSKSGAAARDVLRTILRRDPFAHVLFAWTPVQGEGAGPEIAEALRRLDQLGRAEVILLCRGGGSAEDLWAFNSEAVARAVVNSAVPVITGIGHETDSTVADLVADLRASTPTAAAEHAVPVRSELRARLDKQAAALSRALALLLESRRRRLLELGQRLRHPRALLLDHAQRLDEATARAEQGMRRRLKLERRRLDAAERRLLYAAPGVRLAEARRRLALVEARLHERATARVVAARAALALLAERLHALSPLAVLGRGFALVRRPDGRLLRSAAEAAPGLPLTLELADGEVRVRVEDSTLKSA